MIPKIIHYCWFGHGEMSPLMKKCIKSWKKYCPDYEIIEWNEDNYDIEKYAFTKQAYDCKKWAFVSDFVRLDVLEKYGGIYLDTDVKLRKSLDDLLNNHAFTGFESSLRALQTGIFGAEPGHKVIMLWLDYYRNREYLVDGKPDMNPNVMYMTDIMLKKGLELNNRYQVIDDMVIYPQTYFCPLKTDSVEKNITKDTYAIHYFTSTWRSEAGRKAAKRQKLHSSKPYKLWIWFRYLPNRIIRFVFGDKFIDKLKKSLNK